MARHRKRPVSRHQWRTHGKPTRPAGPRQMLVASAMRRVVVTPTFAAGLGVVVAAVLAYQMGTPSFRVNTPRWNGQPCATAGCVAIPGQAGPASAGGQRLRAPTPAPTAAGGTRTARSTPPAAGHPSAPGPPRPAIAYQTVDSWPGGFQGILTVSFAGGHTPGHWSLRFSYATGRIERIWGTVEVRRHSVHTAVIVPAAAAWQVDGGQEVWVWLQVAGRAGPPSGCAFDRRPCHIQGLSG